MRRGTWLALGLCAVSCLACSSDDEPAAPAAATPGGSGGSASVDGSGGAGPVDGDIASDAGDATVPAKRRYQATASVGDFLAITVDGDAHQITYSNVSNGTSGTVSYTVA